MINVPANQKFAQLKRDLTRDYLFPVDNNDIDKLEMFTTKPPELGCLEENAMQFQHLMQDNGREMPSSCNEHSTGQQIRSKIEFSKC